MQNTGNMASGKAVDTAAIRALLKTLEDQPQRFAILPLFTYILS
jgi:hypothetical protein